MLVVAELTDTPVGTGCLYVQSPDMPHVLVKERRSVAPTEREESAIVQYLALGGHRDFSSAHLLNSAETPFLVASGVHAGPGQLVFGASPTQRCDLMLAFKPSTTTTTTTSQPVVLEFHNYHGDYWHYGGHSLNCRHNSAENRINGVSTLKVLPRTRFYDDFRKALAEGFSCVRPDRVVFRYTTSLSCDYVHSPRLKSLRASSTIYTSVGELLSSEFDADETWVFGRTGVSGQVALGKSKLLEDIRQGKITGFATVVGGRESVDDDCRPPGDLNARAASNFGFCVQNYAPKPRQISPYTRRQIARHFGWLPSSPPPPASIQRQDGVIVVDDDDDDDGDASRESPELKKKIDKYLRNQPARTLNSGTFHTEETVSTTYLRWLMLERGLVDFDITHFIEYKFTSFGRKFLEPVLQRRHDLKRAGNKVGAECLKLIGNGSFGYNGLESCNYDRVKLVTDVNLNRALSSKKMAHLSSKHVTLIGLVKTKLKNQRRRRRQKNSSRRQQHFAASDEAMEVDDDDDDDDEEGGIVVEETVDSVFETMACSTSSSSSSFSSSSGSQRRRDSDDDDDDDDDLFFERLRRRSLPRNKSKKKRRRRDKKGLCFADYNKLLGKQSTSAASQQVNSGSSSSSSSSSSNSSDDENLDRDPNDLDSLVREAEKDWSRVTQDDGRVTLVRKKRVRSGPKCRYKYNYLYALTVSGADRKVKNTLHKAVAILSNSKRLFLGHINVLLRCLDPSMAEICYVDTDSCIFSTTLPDLERCLLPWKKDEFARADLLADEDAVLSCHGKLKLEGLYRAGKFKTLKIYRLFQEGYTPSSDFIEFSGNPDGELSAESVVAASTATTTTTTILPVEPVAAYTRCKGVNRWLATRLPDSVFGASDSGKTVVHRTALRPLRTGEMIIAHEARALAVPFNLKRWVCADGYHTFPLSRVSDVASIEDDDDDDAVNNGSNDEDDPKLEDDRERAAQKTLRHRVPENRRGTDGKSTDRMGSEAEVEDGDVGHGQRDSSIAPGHSLLRPSRF